MTRLLKATCILIAGLVIAGSALAGDASTRKEGRVTVPAFSPANPEIAHPDATGNARCVEPTDVMRRDHMKFILHQRDRTMHKGIRTSKHSLKNCISCHADPETHSVLGEKGFCASCHHYTAIHIDCFSCHNPKAVPMPARLTEPVAPTPATSGITIPPAVAPASPAAPAMGVTP